MANILRLPAVMEKTGLSRSGIWEMQNTGEFPHSIKISKRAMGWIDEDIELWIEERAGLTQI